MGTSIRVGHHRDFDRVVYTFDGPGPLSYLVRWVDAPIGEVSGEPESTVGDTWLEVRVANMRAFDAVPPPPTALTSADLAPTAIMAAKPLWTSFEGVGQVFISVRGARRGFRAFTLTNAVRLVVDIAAAKA